MIELKEYQHSAVNELTKQLRGLLNSSGEKVCVFKAPTGSGKTIMMAELLQRLSSEELPNKYVFVWTSLYDLHSQSKDKLASYLQDTRYNLLSLDEITQDALGENSVLFVNWHSLTTTKQNSETNQREWSNVFVKDREDGRSIIDVLEKTREAGQEIILIVDEAHRNYLTENSQRFIAEAVKPKLTIEVSATPLLKVDAEDMQSKKAGFVSVPFDEVVTSGLIKQETSINQAIGKYVDIAVSADELVVEAALAKRSELAELYEQNELDVNPLILVQLPSDSEKTSALDKSVREEVEQQLAKHGITYANGKLAVWLSDDKQNLELIEKNNSEAEVLIFKEAVAVGWDCPRAQVLVMLRAIRSLTFEIQTVGRILRMPEAKHYEIAELNKAFVYTNISGININNKPEDLDFFKTHFAHKKDGISDLQLPSVYLHRQDYGDLTASFSQILVDALNERFGIVDTDMVNVAYEKADVELELDADELKTPLLADVVLHNLDTVQDEIGTLNLEKIQADVSDANIQKEFDYLLKAWCLPYAPVRSFSKVKTAFYKWFGYIGYDQSKWHEVQRIIACSHKNQTVFDEVMKTAKLKYEKIKPAEIASKKTTTHSTFSLPETDMFGDNYELMEAKKYPYTQCYLRKDRSEPEQYLERLLEDSSKVEWWYKNGEAQQQYFALSYQTVDEETKLTKLANFYPDYIVRYTDGSIGVYDTKAGRTVTEQATHDKSDALQAYIAAENGSGANLSGGILNKRNDGIYLFTGAKYTPELDKWQRFTV
ncbi:DEAD/DEAH box helicase family protein [Candidatus Saccharibacteria bacterium]|jgi:type III restriction enzyme|nr:DEAD/DEAH box helicase family protein [Candidatus Saccharibacteria bacterium]